METCHLCKAELAKRTTEDWREDVPKKKRVDGEEYVWKTLVTKEYACGTVVREGDRPEGLRRVDLGDDCIDV